MDVWIVDSSALIKAKTIVAVNKQWSSFKYLEQMVIEGRIALPRQVIKGLFALKLGPGCFEGPLLSMGRAVPRSSSMESMPPSGFMADVSKW